MSTVFDPYLSRMAWRRANVDSVAGLLNDLGEGGRFLHTAMSGLQLYAVFSNARGDFLSLRAGDLTPAQAMLSVRKSNDPAHVSVLAQVTQALDNLTVWENSPQFEARVRRKLEYGGAMRPLRLFPR